MYRCCLFGILFILINFIALFRVSNADEVTFAWDASKSDNVTSYKIYWTSSGSRYRGHVYDNSQDVGNVTMYTLEIGDKAWVTVTAIDVDFESDYSNEVHYSFGRPGKSDSGVVW